MSRTEISGMKIKQPLSFRETTDRPQIEWQEAPAAPRGHSMLRNLGVASALVLCAVTLRTGALPTLSDATDAVLTAATDHSLLDEQLGRLSFVSALFPETVLVFGESQATEIAMPVSGGMVVHAWTQEEPYVSMRTNHRDVLASFDGEVSGIYHGNGDERLLQLSNDEGLSCIYGNLETISVETGEQVKAGTVLGQILPGKDLSFELRKHGISVDPAGYMSR